jgi:hypothetical protein
MTFDDFMAFAIASGVDFGTLPGAKMELLKSRVLEKGASSFSESLQSTVLMHNNLNKNENPHEEEEENGTEPAALHYTQEAKTCWESPQWESETIRYSTNEASCK